MNSNGVLRELQLTKYSRTSGMMEEGGDGGGDEGGDGGDERDRDGDIEKEMKTKGTGLSKSRL